MEVRAKVAAATAAVVPFNCIICFDEFNLKDRLPMVLPCGHTFVCGPCSKRLKKCMECREPLYFTVPKKTVQQGPTSRGRYSPTPLTPPQSSMLLHHQQTQQIPYPIPKNLVLISMMEAAQQQTKAIIQKEEEESREPESSVIENDTEDSDEEEDEEEFDLDRMLTGMATFSGPCGTYAVKDPDGVQVVPIFPPAKDVSITESESGQAIEVREQNTLRQGQTVQIVSYEDEVAKLARGQGYIRASYSQLVKGTVPSESFVLYLLTGDLYV